MRKLRREAAILSNIDHPNVVKLMGLSVADNNLALVMELAPRGSLRVLLSTVPSSSLTWNKRLAMLRDAAVANAKGIVRRDLKSSNLLVDENLSTKVLPKVGDFGFPTAKEDNGTMARRGTPSWTAPELLLAPASKGRAFRVNKGTFARGSPDECMPDEKVDVYSFGIVMWEVATRRVPYEDANLAQLHWTSCRAIDLRCRATVLLDSPRLCKAAGIKSPGRGPPWMTCLCT